MSFINLPKGVKLVDWSASEKLNEDGTIEPSIPTTIRFEHSNRSLGPVEVLAFAWLPQMGQRYNLAGESAGVFVVNREAKLVRPTARGTLWEVNIDYERFGDPNSNGNENDEPSEDDHFTLSCSWESVRKPLYWDRNGKVVCNSAGDRYPQPVEYDHDILAMTLTRSEKRNPLPKVLRYHNTVNSLSFFGFPREKVKLCITPNWTGKNWSVSYVFQVNPDGWKVKVLDQGLRAKQKGPFPNGAEIEQPGFEVVRPILENGHQVTTPRFLKEGKVLPIPEDAPWSVTPSYQEYEIRAAVDFTPLWLPTK